MNQTDEEHEEGEIHEPVVSPSKKVPTTAVDELDIYGDMEEQQQDEPTESTLVIDSSLPADLLLIQSDIIGVVDRKGDYVPPAIIVPPVPVAAEESSSDESSSSDDDDGQVSDFQFSESDGEEDEKKNDKDHGKSVLKRKPTKNDDDDDFDDETGVGSKVLRSKNEITELPPIEKLDIQIPASAHLLEIGTVFALVQDTMVIQSVPNPSTTLDADSILCSADRKVIGKVFETFGPVVQPMYSVRYDPAVSDLVMSVGDQVYFVKEMAKYVFAAQLRLLKGSDASNRDDEEIAVDEMEFSDDEQEAEYKRQLKLKKKRKGEDDITDPQVDNAESRLNPRSQRGTRGGGRGGWRSSFDDHRGGRGGGGFTGRGSYESSRGGYDGSRSASNYSARGNHNSHSTSQPPRSTHALPPKPHALPPRPTSANIPLSTGPAPMHLGMMSPMPQGPANTQQILAFMQQQQLQLQQQHQQQILLATAALQRGSGSGFPNDGAEGGNAAGVNSQNSHMPFNPMMMNFGMGMGMGMGMPPQMMFNMMGAPGSNNGNSENASTFPGAVNMGYGGVGFYGVNGGNPSNGSTYSGAGEEKE